MGPERGAPVLLLHGFLHSSWTWRKLIVPLAERGHRVLALDLYGYGLSEGPPPRTRLDLPCWRAWIDEALATLGVESLALAVGNSLGGAIALDLADRFSTERLGLINPLCAPLRLPGFPFRVLGQPALGGLFRLTAGREGFNRRALRLTAYRDLPVDKEVLRGFSHLKRPDAHRVACASAASLRQISRHVAEVAPGLCARTRTLCLLGARDRVLGRRYQRRLKEVLRGARIVELPQTGHCPQESDPLRVLEELDQLWES
jgi:pimeloyl-ACP methyl ester carboxylesterase